jgi:hypothetical protein
VLNHDTSDFEDVVQMVSAVQCKAGFLITRNVKDYHIALLPVLAPVDLRIYQRYEELTRWEEFVHKHFPERKIPVKKKERNALHR